MGTVYLGWEVVWSLPLVVAIIGSELAVFGAVGVVAATPQGSNVILLSSPSPNVSESTVVSFTPAPVWGARSVALASPCPQGAYVPPGRPVLCDDEVQIASCVDAGCQHLGDFRAAVLLDPVTPVVSLHVPVHATTFLFTLDRGSLSPVGVQMVWWDTGGLLVQGFTTASAAFAWIGGVGLGLSVAAWIVLRRSGRRSVREVPLADPPARGIAPTPRSDLLGQRARP